MTMHLGKKGISLQQNLKSRLCVSTCVLAFVQVIATCIFMFASAVSADTLDQAKRIHDRIAGVPPSEAVLVEMKDLLDDDPVNGGVDAAMLAMENDNFYNVTLKNWVAPWTNREINVFVPLNDYIATTIGIIRDDIDFRQVLYGDILYTGNGINPAYSSSSNAHYEAIESSGASLQTVLERQTQSSLVAELPPDATAGVITSRAAAKSFFIAGTNRANFRFTLLNHLCMDLEQVHDITRVPDRIRQDVSRSPGGDSRVWLNNCLGCHAGMDPMAQAFAYYNYEYDPDTDLTGENGQIRYNNVGELDAETGTRVQEKYHINSATFPQGFVTPDDSWDNYWREGQNKNLGWDESLPGGGNGAKTMLTEMAHSRAFAQCQVKKAFKAVCLREPGDQNDRDQISDMVTSFTSSGYLMKNVFAEAANYCKGN